MKTALYSFWILLGILSGCSKSGGYRIGVDPSFYRENFQNKDPYVLGFTEEFFLDVSKMENVNFHLFTDNWDSLLDDLRAEKYDAVVSSLPPYNFNEALYDFSESFLEIGPVIVVPQDSKIKKMKNLKGLGVGVVQGTAAERVVQKEPEVMIRSYDTIQEAFLALKEENVNALVVDKLGAIGYVETHQAKIIDDSLTNEALRFVTKHDENERLLRYFNTTIRKMKKKSSFIALMKKWSLTPS